MSNHEFLFTPGLWVGEGRVTFSKSPNILRFYTKWEITKDDEGMLSCAQRVEMQGREEDVINTFAVFDVTSTNFILELTNEQLGIVLGKGIIEPKTIAWEFRGDTEFQGFEVYELQDNGDYMLHAEYTSTEHYRTTIDGRIWEKEEK